MAPKNFSYSAERKVFKMNAFRGKVISASTETRAGDTGEQGVSSFIAITITTIHVQMDSGLQKSIETSTTEVHCIPGNEVFFIATDEDKLIFLKNFASEKSATATVYANNPGYDGKGFWFLIIALVAIYAAFQYSKIAGILLIIFSLYFLVKVVKSDMSQMDIYNKQFRDLLVANGIDITTCKSNLNPVPAAP